MNISNNSSDLDFGLNDNLNLNQENNNPYNITKNTSVENKDKFELYELSDKGNILALCLKDSVDFNDQEYQSKINNIYNEKITLNKLDSLKDIFILQKCSHKILNNKTHLKETVIIEKKYLECFNHKNYDLNYNELVVIMIDIKEEFFKKYNKIYAGQFSMKDLIDLSILCDYYNSTKFQNYKYNLSIIINNINESLYWNRIYNCNLSFTKKFKDRTFSYNTGKINNSIFINNSFLDNEVNINIHLLEELKSMPVEGIDYLRNIYRKDVYINASVSIEKNGYKLYRISNKEVIDKTKVNELFNMSSYSKKDIYDLFNTFLLSKEYCHLVLNNDFILDLVSPLINKYKILYKYIFGYAWLYFYIEECIKKSRITINDRFVFNIDTASKLPSFPICSDDIHQSPYMPLLVSKNLINSKKNLLGIPNIKNLDYYKVDNLSGFKRKFNIFTTRKSDKNIFDGLNWDGSIAISGSIIPACVPKYHPQIKLLCHGKYGNYEDMTDVEYTENYNRFYNEYYFSSDIDIMCNHLDTFKYISKVNEIKKVIQKNLNNNLNTIINKKVNILVNYDFIKNHSSFDLEYIKNNQNDSAFLEELYGIYISNKIKKNNEFRNKYKDELKNIDKDILDSFYSFEDSSKISVSFIEGIIKYDSENIFDTETLIFKNDIVGKFDKVNNNENSLVLKINDTIKYKIKSEENGVLNHDIEIFRIRYSDFNSCISRFHLPVVRGFYDGNTVYLLPSCISAINTNINIEYKYFAGIRDPIQIINKYLSRGYGTIINDPEKIHFMYYNSKCPIWKPIFNININKYKNYDKHFGPLLLNNEIFKINKFFNKIPDEIYNNEIVASLEYIISTEELKNEYISKGFPEDVVSTLLKLKTINDDGSVFTIQKWVMDFVWFRIV